jgi:hypothetical protein
MTVQSAAKAMKKVFAILRRCGRNYLTNSAKICHSGWPILCSEVSWGEIRAMLETKVKNGEELLKLSAAGSPADAAPGKAAIVLHDLTTEPEEETNRLGTRMSELTAEIGSLRNENQRLKAELREVKLVLSKIQIEELRKFEKVNSWLRSFKKMI